jgi:antitoxin component of MazEF toxin-antitoxin module
MVSQALGVSVKAQVIKVGNEIALILPNEIVRMLDLREGQQLYASRPADGGFRIGVDDPIHDKGMRIAEEAMVKYAETFKALAKS